MVTLRIDAREVLYEITRLLVKLIKQALNIFCVDLFVKEEGKLFLEGFRLSVLVDLNAVALDGCH